MAIIWDQSPQASEEEIEKIIEEAEQDYEVKAEVEERARQLKSPFRGFGN
jgi:hypothetical protein